jgi:protein TonB
MLQDPLVRSNQEAIEILFPPDRTGREGPRALLAAVLIHMALLLVVLPGKAPKPKQRYVTVPRDLLTIMSPTVRAPDPPPPPPAPEPPQPASSGLQPPQLTPTLRPVRVVEPPPPAAAGSGLPELLARASSGFPPSLGQPESPPAPSRPVRLPEEALRVLHLVKPEYPLIARRARLEGKVILDVHIDEEGHVTDIEVLKRAPLGLTEAAVEAVKQWRYEPARIGDRAVPAVVAVRVNYVLE